MVPPVGETRLGAREKKGVFMRSQANRWKKILSVIRESYPFGPMETKTDLIGRLHNSPEEFAVISPTRCTQYFEGVRHGLDVDIWGTTFFYFKDRLVPKRYILEPETLTIQEVLAEENTELRYVGMLAIGFENLLNDPVAKVIDTDTKKSQVLFQIEGIYRSPVTYIRVKNASKEPDGTYKFYYLCVPPHMTKCNEAVAWTFRKTPETYHPVLET